MHSANLQWGRQAARSLITVLACAFLLSLFTAYAQESASDTSVFRADRPHISLTARNSTGEVIKAAGTVKLLHDGILADQAGLSHGRAFFGPLSFGDYTLVVEVAGFKP